MGLIATLTIDELIERLKSGDIKGGDIPQEPRIQLVGVMRLKVSERAIADLLGVSERTIRRDVAELKERAAKGVEGLSVQKIAGEILTQAAALQQEARRAGNLRLVWDVTKDAAEILMDLGLLHRAPVKTDATIHVDALSKLDDKELDDMYQDIVATEIRNTEYAKREVERQQ